MKRPARIRLTIVLLLVYLIVIGLLTYFVGKNDGSKDYITKSGFKNTIASTTTGGYCGNLQQPPVLSIVS